MQLVRRWLNETSVSDFRASLSMVAILGCLGMVLIGINPLGAKVKQIPFTGEGDYARQIWYLGVFAIAVITTQAGVNKTKWWPLPVMVTVALAWCWLSLSWSLAPSIGMRRLLLTTMLIYTIFRAANVLGYERTVWAMRFLCVVTLILSYIAMKVTPASIHVEVEAGDPELIGNWRGILAHKNYAGAVFAMTILLFVFDAKKIPMWLRVIVIVGTAFFLIQTHSKTSQGLLLAMMAVGAIFAMVNPRLRIIWVPILACVVTAVVIYLQVNWDEIARPFGSGAAFTGRARIWGIVGSYVLDNWATGTGFGSFWNIGASSPIFEYARGWVSGLATAHNGYLDLAAQVGVPGAVLVIICYVVTPIVNLVTNLSIDRGRASLLLALLLFCICHNLTESSLWDRDAIVQTFMTFTVALIYIQPRTASVSSILLKDRQSARDRMMRRRLTSKAAQP